MGPWPFAVPAAPVLGHQRGCLIASCMALHLHLAMLLPCRQHLPGSLCVVATEGFVCHDGHLGGSHTKEFVCACRYEKRHTNISAHISPCFRCREGDTVVIGQCR